MSNERFRQTILVFVLIAIPSFVVTGNYIISDSPAPLEGMEENPYPSQPLSEGMLFVVIDGGGRHMMSNPDFMPNLNARVQDGAYLEIETNPMTMTAICIKEIATGVPSKPNEALSNFHPEHPGTPDGWNLASIHDGDNDGEYDHQVGILGDYVWKGLYPDRELIPFSKHRYGHADYYQGDEEAFDTLRSWLEGDAPAGYDKAPNIIIAHLSGLDSIGHRYGAKDSAEYEEKLQWLDDNLEMMFELVPENWTVFVTADHGLTDGGQHGSPEAIIRETAGFMWGPNIAKGVTVEDVTQRDLATLPSIIFGLPLPHAIHGKIPLDIFDLTEEEYQTYDQWNWDATVERNNWMEENGHSYVEGLDKDDIEWDKIKSDEIGMRNIDLWISAIAVIAFSAFLYRKFKSDENTKKYAILAPGLFFVLFSASTFLSYSRDWMAWLYYPLGLVGLVLLYWMSKKAMSIEKPKTEIYTIILASVLFFTIIYPETRFTILSLPIWLGMILILENKMFVSRENSTPKRLLIPMILILVTAIFFSDYRIYGFSAPRFMVMLTQSQEPDAVIWSVIIAFVFTLIYATRKREGNWPAALAIASAMATIPVLISQNSNSVDWVLIWILIAGVVCSIILKFLNKPHSFALFQYCAFAWLTMSWGAWGGGISMIFFGTVESLMNREWSVLKIKRDNPYSEFGRHILLGLIPIGIWFAWWATLGQTDGLQHPRDIDPGNLFLKGGYIGDRLSPSNNWVFLMGACPVILMGTLWWNLFRKNWPLQMAFIILSVRLAALAIQLSVSPNLPRLVFKIGWDMLFCILLITASGFFMLYDKWLVKESKTVAN